MWHGLQLHRYLCPALAFALGTASESGRPSGCTHALQALILPIFVQLQKFCSRITVMKVVTVCGAGCASAGCPALTMTGKGYQSHKGRCLVQCPHHAWQTHPEPLGAAAWFPALTLASKRSCSHLGCCLVLFCILLGSGVAIPGTAAMRL